MTLIREDWDECEKRCRFLRELRQELYRSIMNLMREKEAVEDWDITQIAQKVNEMNLGNEWGYGLFDIGEEAHAIYQELLTK